MKYRRNSRKRKTVWAYLDGKPLIDVVQAAGFNFEKVEELHHETELLRVPGRH